MFSVNSNLFFCFGPNYAINAGNSFLDEDYPDLENWRHFLLGNLEVTSVETTKSAQRSHTSKRSQISHNVHELQWLAPAAPNIEGSAPLTK